VDHALLDRLFPRYTEYDPKVPVWDLTPEGTGWFHRFFDTSPLSPSGRFLAATRFEPERMPEPGEAADVVLVDLHTGRNRVVWQSRGWDTQLGAQVQWGADDSQLFFNDMDPADWRPFGVRHNPLDGTSRRLEGTIYMVSPDGRQALSPCLLRTGLTQAGYGVLAPPEHVPLNHGAAADDGIYLTDTETGACRLLVSFASLAHDLVGLPPSSDGDFYAFHLKWNPQGTRIMLVLRWKPHAGSTYRPNVVTLNADGTDPRLAIPHTEWAEKGGHHPNWEPDGEHVMMNLKIDGPEMRFVHALYDGTGYGAMHPTALGSGHPTLHPDNRHIITDAYQHSAMAHPDGSTPVRWVDLATGRVVEIIRARTRPLFKGAKSERRVDPHPAWDRTFRYVALNACPGGRRTILLADLAPLLH
jgi:Tol biopolymer transport system component